MNTRDRIKMTLKVESENCPRGQILDMLQNRDQFEQFCGEFLSETGRFDDYLETHEWGRLITETWNEWREDIQRRVHLSKTVD